MLGVHTPESRGEADLAAVERKAKEDDLAFPIAVDNQAATWKAWDNRWWPSIYLIDKKGYARYRWDGELKWKGAAGEEIMRQKIEALLKEKE